MLQGDELLHGPRMCRIDAHDRAVGAVRRELDRMIRDRVGSAIPGGLQQEAQVEQILAGMEVLDRAARARCRKHEYVMSGPASEYVRTLAGLDDVVTGTAADRVIAGRACRDQ